MFGFLYNMEPINNIVDQRQHLTRFTVWDLQEDIYNQMKKATTCWPVGVGDSSIDNFREVQNGKYSYISHLIGYIAYGLHLSYKMKNINGIAENLFPNSLA